VAARLKRGSWKARLSETKGRIQALHIKIGATGALIGGAMAEPSQRRARARQPKNPAPIVQPARLNFSWLRQTTWFVLTALALSFYLHFNSDNFADPDSFYHFRHGALYATTGPFAAEFPWARYSVIGRLAADIWYGFHILLLPFAWFGDPLIGMRLAGMLVTAAFLVAVYWVCRLLEVKAAPLWPFVLLFSSAFLLHRLTMLRPHVLSLALSVLIFGLLAARRIGAVFLAAFAVAWLHLTLFFVPLVVLGVFAVVKLVSERIWLWRESAALACGLALGWLLRPNPLGAAEIVYVQLFQWTVEKLAGAPLEVGSELRPLAIAFHSNYLPHILISSLALLFLLWRILIRRVELAAEQRTLCYAAAALSLGFFFLALLFARRAFDFSSSFAVLTMALIFSYFLAERKWLGFAFFALSALLAFYGLSLRDRVLAVAWPADRVFTAARWLEAHSEPGDIVFNLRWEYFAELFFWNTKNHYIGGMDPIFQYAFDPELYRAGLAVAGHGSAAILCPGGACGEADAAQSYEILKGKFNARYVFLLKQPDAVVFLRLLADKRFGLRHHDEHSAVFELR